MRTRQLISSAFAVATLSLVTAGLHAAGKSDLDRNTPVPANEPIPIADFFRTPAMADPVLNPAGTHVAATVPAGEDNTSLMAYDLQTQHVETMGTNLDRDIFGARWLSNSRLMYQMAVRKVGSGGFYATHVGAFSSAYPLIQFVGADIIAIPLADRTHPLAQLAPDSMNTDQFGTVAVLDSDLKSGTVTDLTRWVSGQQQEETRENNERHIQKRFPSVATATRFALNYHADRAGQLAFGVTSTDGAHHLHQFVGGHWEQCPQDLDETGFWGAGNNPGEIVLLAARADGKPRPLQFVDAASGKVVQELIKDSGYDFNGQLYRDAATNNVVGGMFNRARPEPVWFDEGYRSLQKAVDALFPGMVVRVIGGDESGKIVLLSTSSDRQPEIFSWVDLSKGTAGLIKNSRPWIDPKRMQPMGMIKFKTRDGRKLDAYLTLPAGATKQNPPPLVVLPHQYQEARDTWQFDATTQFLASRGYAVLQPNYRGSAGYGWMFPLEDEWDFAKMQEDVADATKTLAGSGLVDRNRIAIMGTEFGGYLALAASAYEPALYRCAIAISPVCDWARYIDEEAFSKRANERYNRLVHKLGDPKSHPEKFDRLSPLRHAGSIKAAVLVTYGEYDAPVKIAQAKDLVSAVRHNQVPAESISFTNEQTGVRHLSHKVELYSRIESFLAEHLR